jgi:hypothetical protein
VQHCLLDLGPEVFVGPVVSPARSSRSMACQTWTTELIELTSIFALLVELHPAQHALCAQIGTEP